MKFSDLDENLVTEAPKGEGKLARAATAIKQKVGPTKKIRQRAEGKQGIQQQGLAIKGQFHKWAGKRDLPTTVEALKQFFIDNDHDNYANIIDEIASDLHFSEPKPSTPTDDNADQQDDSADQQVEPTAGDEQEDMISPEKMTGETQKRELTPDEQAGLDKINRDAEEESAEYERKEKQGLNASKGDNEESKVDMSASIYESRLNYFLLLERELKDNQLDTLIVRVLQAAKRDGDETSTSEPEQQQKQAASAEEPENKEAGWRQKISKALTGTGDVGDLAKGDEVSSSGKVSSEDGSMRVGANEYEPLLKLLNKIQKSTKPLDPNDRKLAKQLLNKIQHANSE